MALNLSKTYKGFVSNYWKITKIVIDDSTNRVIVEMSLYKDRSTRMENVNNMMKTITRVFPFGAWLLSDNIKSACYGKIKESIEVDGQETNEFYNSSDEME